MSPLPPQAGFARELRAYAQGDRINVYLVGIPKPLTHLTVCQVTETTLIARWNSSTHLIPIARIAYCRYAPDADPCRRIEHPLHDVVKHNGHRPARTQNRNQGESGKGKKGPLSPLLQHVLEGLKPLNQENQP